ncbi:MAG: geranylgeranylglycerol-phosphate geranylgeranyltransferase [Ferruginibacter sp.]
MQTIAAFFRLIRWPNLIFIALTQSLFYYCIIVPSLPESYRSLQYRFTDHLFFLLMAASILIAAAGYIINDYFDINIDLVNKPDKLVIEKFIKRRWAIVLHISITLVGLALSFYVSLYTGFIVFVGNVICAIFLWVYSTTFKKKLLSGNILIALLTAWTVLVLYAAVNTTYVIAGTISKDIPVSMFRIYRLAVLYSGFAFIITLIREAVKDIEDIQGDARYQCKTMPIVWGIPAARVYVGVWLTVLLGALSIITFYAFLLNWWGSAIYLSLLVILPLVFLIRTFIKAQTVSDYHQLSTYIKLLMLTGIVSMAFFLL